MSSGEVLKAEKDFSKEADAQIPEAEKLGKVAASCRLARAKLMWYSRATHKLPSTSCFRSRRRPVRYGATQRAHAITSSPSPGLRPCVYQPGHHCHRHNSQECRRLEPHERAGPPAIEEAWSAQAGHHQDGADRHDLPRRYPQPRHKALRDRDAADSN
jgi:hypothetical protein